MKKEFTKEDTKIIKGFAIVLMLMHHLWGVPTKMPNNSMKYFINIFGESSLVYFGSFGKICVSIFFFLSGYGIYKIALNKKLNIIERIKKLYLSYWKVFLIFIPIAFIFFRFQKPYCTDALIYARYKVISFKNIISCFLGLNDSLNGEWWFFKDYIITLLIFPFVKKIINKFSLVKNIFIVIIFSILISSVIPALGNISLIGALNTNSLYINIFHLSPFISSFLMGMVFAKENLLVKIDNKLRENFKFNILFDIIIFFIIIFLRESVFDYLFDIFFVPILIIVVRDFITRSKILTKVFLKLGNQSTNMWLIHSFYCYYFYFFVKIVIFPKYAILCLILLIIMSYFSGVLLDYFWKFIKYLYNKLILLKNKILKNKMKVVNN